MTVLPENKSEPHGHIPALDGVRGVAILLVLLFHFKAYLIGPEMLQGAIGLAGYFGWAGVDLFFVLSGFLITRILLAARSNEGYFSTFYTRRVFRIFPLYYGVLFLIFLGPWRVIAGVLPPARDHVWYWTYLSNWSIMLKSANPQGVGHFWSLAVEEQFYLAWPLLVWWLDGRALFRVTVALCAAAPIWRIALISKHWDPEWIYRNTFSRMDTLLVGAAVAITFSAGHRTLITRHAVKIVGVATSALVFVIAAARTPLYTSRPMQTAGYSLIAIICASLIACTASPEPSWISGVFNRPALRFAGKYSYGMYVFHMPVFVMARTLFDARMQKLASIGLGFLVVGALTAATVAIAFCSYELFERRVLNLTPRRPPTKP